MSYQDNKSQLLHFHPRVGLVEQLIDPIPLKEHVDYFEIKSFDPSKADHYKSLDKDILMHLQYVTKDRLMLNLAVPDILDIMDEEEFHRYFNLLKPPVLSMHLGFGSSIIRSQGQGQYILGTGETLLQETIYNRIIKNVATVRRITQNSLPIFLENMDYTPLHLTTAYQHICNPDFIREVIISTDTYFLLDIGHALVSAKNLDYTLDHYLSLLPLDRVREIHLSKPGMENGILRDLHLPIDDEILTVLRSLIPAVQNVDYITLETFGSLENTIDSLHKIREVIAV